MSALRLPVLSLLLLTPIMIAIGQVLFKITSEKLVAQNAPFHTVLINPVFILALMIYASATLLWIYVLKTVPLSQAYAFMAMTFVIVPLLAMLWLGETLTLKYAIGTILVIAGLIVVQS